MKVNLLKEKGLVNDTALYLFALVRHNFGNRLDAVPRATESGEVSLALLLSHLLDGLHFFTPLSSGAELLVHAANLARALGLGQVGVLADGDASGLLHSRCPFQSVVLSFPVIIL